MSPSRLELSLLDDVAETQKIAKSNDHESHTKQGQSPHEQEGRRPEEEATQPPISKEGRGLSLMGQD